VVTFSIVGRSADGRAVGVAVASKFLAVGAVVPGVEAGVGAIATQALANPTYLPDGLRALREGGTAEATLAALTAADGERDHRQAGIVDRNGGSATFTGTACHEWAGGIADAGVAIQGNILTGPDVVEAMRAAWFAASPDLPLARRLLAALQAGDAAGGDRRGRQSAALLVVSPAAGYGGLSDVQADLRVDDHPQPVEELARLLDLHHVYFERPATEELVPIEGDVADRVTAALTALGYATLDDWVGVENYEMRVTDGQIDRYVLDVLERQARLIR
jgi:uncharacterized Ntn-hydrolase superfamily protein